MSYTKSSWDKDTSTAHFSFPQFKRLDIKLDEEEDMRKLELMFDHCTKLGAEQEREQHANR